MLSIFFIFSWLGCSSEQQQSIPYTTARIGNYEPVGRTDLELKIYSNEKDCNRLINDLGSNENIDDCMPYIDRGRGEVHLAFSFQLDGGIYPLPNVDDHMDISHQGNLVGVSNREVLGNRM